MKLIVCRQCNDWNALSWSMRECRCGRTGGKYNPDGDTATVFGDGILFGFSNHAWAPLVINVITEGQRGMKDLSEVSGDNVLWIYDDQNGKITRLSEKPVGVSNGTN